MGRSRRWAAGSLSGVIESVIFDCDGVLVDSEPIAAAVLASLLTEAGLQTTADDCAREYRGRAMEAVLELARAQLGGPLPDDLAERYYADLERRFAAELRPVPGALDALERIALPSCVASSGPHRKLRVTLRQTGLWERFEGRIFSAGDVGAGKPAPDLFLHAAAAMGFDPARTAVVEDSVPGVQAARAAGMRALALARAGHGEAAALAAAGGEPFSDMAQLPALLADDR